MAEETKNTDQKPKVQQKPKAEDKLLAAVLIRSTVRASNETILTLNKLKLYQKNSCSVYPATDTIKGMLRKVQDYVTYGEISADTLKELQAKRGKKDDSGKMANNFNLAPPRGGFEKKGIKRSFTNGGALGNRREKINKLLLKMI